MKSLVQFIKEAIDQVVIKDLNGNVLDVSDYAYDKDSLERIINTNEEVYIAKIKNKSTWTTNTDEVFKISKFRQDNNFMMSDKSKFSKLEIIELLEEGNIMVITI